MMRMEMEQGVGEAKRAAEAVRERVGEGEAVKERVGESNDKQ